MKHIVFSSTAAVYGTLAEGTAGEETPTAPINPYGTSKLMSEWMLRDLAFAGGPRYVALRYFNVAGCDAQGRIGQSTKNATLADQSRLRSGARQTRARRDLRHRLRHAGRHRRARLHPRRRSRRRASQSARVSAQRRRFDHAQLRLRPRLFGARRARRRRQGPRRGGRRSSNIRAARAIRRRSSRAPSASARRSAGIRVSTIWISSRAPRWRGNESSPRRPA